MRFPAKGNVLIGSFHTVACGRNVAWCINLARNDGDDYLPCFISSISFATPSNCGRAGGRWFVILSFLAIAKQPTLSASCSPETRRLVSRDTFKADLKCNRTKHITCCSDRFPFISFQLLLLFFPLGEGAVLGFSARPRQPVARVKQASIPWPRSKNQFNI